MKQLNVSIENCFAPKAVSVFVPLAYQAIMTESVRQGIYTVGDWMLTIVPRKGKSPVLL